MITGVANFRFRMSFVGAPLVEVPRCNPVVLAGQFAVPEFVMVQVNVTWPPGATEVTFKATFSGTKFGRGASVAIVSGPDGSASSERELWFNVLFSTASAITHK